MSRVGALGLFAALVIGMAVQPAAAAASGSPTPGGPTPSVASSVTVPGTAKPAATATPVGTVVTDTTTVTRRPLPTWVIVLVVALALGGALAAYPTRRRR